MTDRGSVSRRVFALAIVLTALTAGAAHAGPSTTTTTTTTSSTTTTSTTTSTTTTSSTTTSSTTTTVLTVSPLVSGLGITVPSSAALGTQSGASGTTFPGSLGTVRADDTRSCSTLT